METELIHPSTIQQSRLVHMPLKPLQHMALYKCV